MWGHAADRVKQHWERYVSTDRRHETIAGYVRVHCAWHPFRPVDTAPTNSGLLRMSPRARGLAGVIRPDETGKVTLRERADGLLRRAEAKCSDPWASRLQVTSDL